jgi:hypothetical protein
MNEKDLTTLLDFIGDANWTESVLQRIKAAIESRPGWEWHSAWHSGKHWFDIAVPDARTMAQSGSSEAAAAIKAVVELDGQ